MKKFLFISYVTRLFWRREKHSLLSLLLSCWLKGYQKTTELFALSAKSQHYAKTRIFSEFSPPILIYSFPYEFPRHNNSIAFSACTIPTTKFD